MKVMKRDWIFILLCLFLAVLAELSLFEKQIGISYSVFLAAFYSVFFYKFRNIAFTHKQFSLLLFVSIWVLAFNYLMYSNYIFYSLNLIVIPILVFIQTVLVTSPSLVPWHSVRFLSLLWKKTTQILRFIRVSTLVNQRKIKHSINKSTYQTGKKIGLGALLAIPFLIVVIPLLSSADQEFAKLLSKIPEKIMNVELEQITRVIKIVIIMMVLGSYLSVLPKKTNLSDLHAKESKMNWDAIMMTTMLVFINIVYALFTTVQFQYFFSGTLQDGLSFSEYARRGFFELMAVTIINFGILLSTVIFVKKATKVLRLMMKLLLTLLISFSGVMLVSAFLRLMMYEQAYGFTYLRIFAHSFMILLFIIFAFTLVKVWIQRLPIARFYIICTLLYYVGLNVIDIDQIIVSKNIERYENTNKIDVRYLGMLSYSAVPDLVELYQQKPTIPGLKNILIEKQMILTKDQEAWQSFNLSKEKAKDALEKVQSIEDQRTH